MKSRRAGALPHLRGPPRPPRLCGPAAEDGLLGTRTTSGTETRQGEHVRLTWTDDPVRAAVPGGRSQRAPGGRPGHSGVTTFSEQSARRASHPRASVTEAPSDALRAARFTLLTLMRPTSPVRKCGNLGHFPGTGNDSLSARLNGFVHDTRSQHKAGTLAILILSMNSHWGKTFPVTRDLLLHAGAPFHLAGHARSPN